MMLNRKGVEERDKDSGECGGPVIPQGGQANGPKGAVFLFLFFERMALAQC